MGEELLAIATLATALTTVALVWLTWNQANQAKNFELANLLIAFHERFFEKERDMIRRIEDHRPLLTAAGGEYTEYDLDDYLAYFELLEAFQDAGVIPEMTIYRMFGHYVRKAHENAEIQDYIASLRHRMSDDGYYMAFDGLARQMARIDETTTFRERAADWLTKLRKAPFRDGEGGGTASSKL